MKIYSGIDALSAFRQKQLLQQLKNIDGRITNVAAEYIHFVKTNKKLNATDEATLKKLLNYGSSFTGAASKQTIIAIPRVGTISPWSSKATDIAHNSGLTNVERIERGVAYYLTGREEINLELLSDLLHDKMIETVVYDMADAIVLFKETKPAAFEVINILENGKGALIKANQALGLALADDEMDYLFQAYSTIGRNPSDAELVMFSVVNSEHCRHKIFNADWVVNGQKQSKSLFKKIRNTYEKHSDNILSAYSDNAAVLQGPTVDRFYPNAQTKSYQTQTETANLVIKVETHNHPTAVAPFPGAATGSGGEIRDEGATGRGAKPKMGLTGFSVSNLHIPDFTQPWEDSYGKPDRIVSPLEIMLVGPLGGAAFNNEFGRPNLAGYFRTYEQNDQNTTVDRWGYHKPIMIAGGLGTIENRDVEKQILQPGDQLIVLGGPAMLIGFGGGTASSMQTGASDEQLDFASVQRSNPEIQRRAQEVINACWSMGDKNPIVSIHDVGAGGLSNALPELVHDAGLGATIQLRNIPSDEPSMSPMEIWCNEAQERYVLGLKKTDVEVFRKLCERERCPFAVVGETTAKEQLVVHDAMFENNPIDIPMNLLFGNPPKMTRSFDRQINKQITLQTSSIKLDEAVERVLKAPAVGSKKFLITIGDRTVGGLTVRDQMVGPWQVPVSDVAVTASTFTGSTGEAMAMGERTPLAVINSAASARIAIGEVITNMSAAQLDKLSDIKLSANWMAAAGHKDQDQALFDAVTTVGEDFCPSLGLTIPVGKDSLSMRTTWQDGAADKAVTSPLSLIATGFAPVTDTAKVLTAQLNVDESSALILIDLGLGQNRLGGSILAQVYNQIGSDTPDVTPEILQKFFDTIQKLHRQNQLLAYHDRSDGGLFTALCEMAFASRCGLDISLDSIAGEALDILLNEELGAVIQVKASKANDVLSELKESLGDCVYEIGQPNDSSSLTFKHANKILYENSRAQLEKWWAETSYRIQALRDNPAAADEEFTAIADDVDPGISPVVNFDIPKLKSSGGKRPRATILREQGVNGQVEMAAAFHYAGFEAVDVHLQDITTGAVSLADFSLLAVCGGFSYGDVLGAGEGWAKSILHNKKLRQEFSNFFERTDTLSFGVCNGCQMLSALKELIPGTEHWPAFKKNISEQFEARFVMVQVNKSNSAFFAGMEGSYLPIPVAHGEGRAEFSSDSKPSLITLIENGCVPLQYVDNYNKVTAAYPFNPNGSPLGITSLSSKDGRATILMPHPERAFLAQQSSWHPDTWATEGPWFKLFTNAYDWIGKHS